MFNYKNTFKSNITKNITPNQLFELIKDNPNKSKIEKVRALRNAGDEYYKEVKNELPIFVPNALFNRTLDAPNFLFSTGYYYLDIDNGGEAYALKEKFLEKYSDIVYMCWVSVSLGGIGILVKLDNSIDDIEKFNDVYSYLTTQVFSEFEFDKLVKNAGRINFISQDSEIFINNDCKPITCEINNKIQKSKNSIFTTNTKQEKNNNSKDTVLYSLNEVREHLIFKTSINFDNKIIVSESIEDYIEVNVWDTIEDGSKRKRFALLIHQLKYLNPEPEKEIYIKSYISYLNNNKTTARIEFKELIKYVDFIFEQIKKVGCHPVFKQKHIHTNKSLKQTSIERTKLGKQLSDIRKKNVSIERVKDAKRLLELQGKKVNKEQAIKLGLSRKIVYEYWDAELYDLEDLTNQINEAYQENPESFNNAGYIAIENNHNKSEVTQISIETPKQADNIETEIKAENELLIESKPFCKWTATDEEKRTEMNKQIALAFKELEGK